MDTNEKAVHLAELAAKTILKYHKELGPWQFKIKRLKSRTLGLCSYAERTVFLDSTYVQVGKIDDLEQTLLHEFAHAMTRGHGHDAVWRSVATMLGVKDPRATRKLEKSEQKEMIEDGKFKVRPARFAIINQEGVILKEYSNRPANKIIARVPNMFERGKPETRGTLKMVRLVANGPYKLTRKTDDC